jgi:DNA-binding NarL/FixJ family response regulator
MTRPEEEGQPPRRILIVDDHPIVREGFSALLDGAPDLEVTGQAQDFDEAVAALDEADPDLAIVDISLPGKTGLELIGKLKGKKPDIRILVVSMHPESVFAERALKAGAQGYIMKGEATEHLLDGVRRVLEGGIFVTERATQSIIEQLARGSQGGGTSPVKALSKREFEVFHLIGEGKRTAEIAEELYLSPKTVETHRANMIAKLGLADGAELNYRAIQWVSAGPDPVG